MWRVTIRELLIVTAFVAGSLASLKYAGPVVWMVIASGVSLCLMISTVIALVDRGRRQAMASGFASCGAIYLAMSMLIASAGHGDLVTESLSTRLYLSMVSYNWYDKKSGEMVAFDPRWETVGYPPSIRRSAPSIDLSYFKSIGHLLWALLFGYFGSRFAAWLHARRHDDER